RACVALRFSDACAARSTRIGERHPESVSWLSLWPVQEPTEATLTAARRRHTVAPPVVETEMARKTTRHIRKLYESGQPISMVTCYDYTFARLVDKAGIDCILVGDSLGNVVQGHDTTLPVTVDDIVYH